MPLKIALIGCGELANSYYGPALIRLQKEGLASLAACVDCNVEKSESFASKYKFGKAYTDGDEMMQQVQPDCLLLVTPVTVTARLAMHYSQFAVAMLLEKPPALTVAEGEALEAALTRNHILHQVAFNRHYMPLVRELKREVDTAGGIQSIQILMSRCGRTAENFYTTAIHSIDLAQYLAGAPYKAVKIMYQNLPSYGAHVKNYFINCVFENGVTGQITVLVCSGMVSERVMVTGDDTSWFVKLPVWECADTPGEIKKYYKDALIYKKTGDEITDGDEPCARNGFYGELKSFLKAVEEGRQPSETMHYALGPVEIAQLLQEQTESYTRQTRAKGEA